MGRIWPTHQVQGDSSLRKGLEDHVLKAVCRKPVSGIMSEFDDNHSSSKQQQHELLG